MQQKVWTGSVPRFCDIHKAHRITTEFVDGRTRIGPWATMCLACWMSHGVGLGSGKGQIYRKQFNIDGSERWVKIAG
jgi:hypothetical protein